MKTILIAVTALLWVSAANAEIRNFPHAKAQGQPLDKCLEAMKHGWKVYEGPVAGDTFAQSYEQVWLYARQLYRLQYIYVIKSRNSIGSPKDAYRSISCSSNSQ